MELKTRIKKVPIIDRDTGETTFHYMKKFDARSLAAYRRTMARAAKIKGGGQKIDLPEVKVKLETWGKMVDTVEGYEFDGVDVTKTDKWRSTVAQFAPEHCIVAIESLDAVFTEAPIENDDDDKSAIEVDTGDELDIDDNAGAGTSEVSFLKKPSPDASDDGSKPNTTS